MKRLFAVLALVAGGLATEAVYPLGCTLAMLTRRERIVPKGGRNSPGRNAKGVGAASGAIGASSTGAAPRGV
ncbi:MAG: hypothetical protein LBV73_17105 [Paraburkholderia sp.]|jgi:hypothetical protein|nr:hypothetical protein [Paraburkholderia sp.]